MTLLRVCVDEAAPQRDERSVEGIQESQFNFKTRVMSERC